MANEVENYPDNTSTPYDDTNLFDITEFDGAIWKSTKSPFSTLRAELGLNGTEGFLPRFAAGDKMGTESNIYEDSNGLIGINTGAASFDAFLTVNYPGGLPNPANLVNFNSVSDGGFKVSRLGGLVSMGIEYESHPFGSGFYSNLANYLFRFSQTGFLSVPFGDFVLQKGGNDLTMTLGIDNVRASNILFDRDGNSASLTYNAVGNNDNLLLNIDSTIVWIGKPSGVLNTPNLPTYADDTAAGVGGLVQGDQYQTATGELRIKL